MKLTTYVQRLGQYDWHVYNVASNGRVVAQFNPTTGNVERFKDLLVANARIHNAKIASARAQAARSARKVESVESFYLRMAGVAA